MRELAARRPRGEPDHGRARGAPEERVARVRRGAPRGRARAHPRRQREGRRERRREGRRGAAARTPRALGRQVEGHAPGTRRRRGAPRSRRPHHEPQRAAERAARRPDVDPARRHRDDLRIAPQRDRRCGGALPQGGQRRHPARRLRGDPLEPRPRRRAARGGPRGRDSGGRDHDRADRRPRGDRRPARALGRRSIS